MLFLGNDMNITLEEIVYYDQERLDEDVAIQFLQEIKEIQGNFNNLKKYKLRLWNIHRENQSYSIYLNSIRY